MNKCQPNGEFHERSRCLDHWKRAVWDGLGFHLPSHGRWFFNGWIFFSAEEVRPSGPQNFRLNLFLFTLLWGQHLSSFRVVHTSTQIVSLVLPQATSTVFICFWFWDVRTRAVGLVKSLFLFGHQKIILSEHIVLEYLKHHKQALKPANLFLKTIYFQILPPKNTLGRPGRFSWDLPYGDHPYVDQVCIQKSELPLPFASTIRDASLGPDSLLFFLAVLPGWPWCRARCTLQV